MHDVMSLAIHLLSRVRLETGRTLKTGSTDSRTSRSASTSLCSGRMLSLLTLHHKYQVVGVGQTRCYCSSCAMVLKFSLWPLCLVLVYCWNTGGSV